MQVRQALLQKAPAIESERIGEDDRTAEFQQTPELSALRIVRTQKDRVVGDRIVKDLRQLGILAAGRFGKLILRYADRVRAASQPRVRSQALVLAILGYRGGHLADARC